MRSSSIKQNSCERRVDRERTHNDIRCSFCGFCTHVVDLASRWVLLLIPVLVLRLSNPLIVVLTHGVLSLARTSAGIVSQLTTTKTPRSRRCIVGRIGALDRTMVWLVLKTLLR